MWYCCTRAGYQRWRESNILRTANMNIRPKRPTQEFHQFTNTGSVISKSWSKLQTFCVLMINETCKVTVPYFEYTPIEVHEYSLLDQILFHITEVIELLGKTGICPIWEIFFWNPQIFVSNNYSIIFVEQYII